MLRMGGHVSAHSGERSYPDMPQPREDWVKGLEIEGYKRVE